MDDIATEIAALDQISTGDLAERYAELHGQPCRTHHRAYLIRKIAWRLQATPRATCPNVPVGGRPNWPTTPRYGSWRPRP
jgi:hypothetical protein